MKIHQIAERLAQLCASGDFVAAHNELYADDIISIGPFAKKNYQVETKGRSAVLAKMLRFMNSIEQSFGNKVSTPTIVGNSIAFNLCMDVIFKGQKRKLVQETCVYEVREGKIISEEFLSK